MKRIAILATALALVAPVQAQTIDRIKSSKTVTIAHRVDSLPFSFDQNGEKLGYTVDICKRIVASLEHQLKISGLSIKWVAATAQNRMELVAKRQADMECGATTVTLGRMEKVDFSSLVFVDAGALMVRTESNIKTLADLAEKKVAVIGGTTTEAALTGTLKQRLVNARIITVKTREEGLAALEAGSADAFASDTLLLAGLAAKAKDPSKLSLVAGDPFSIEPYAIVLPRGDWEFRLAVNRALSQIYRSGDIKQIFDKYFGQIGSPTPLLMATYVLNSFSE